MGKAAAVSVWVAALGALDARATGEACSPESVNTQEATWSRGTDALTGATDYGFPQAQVPALLQQLEKYLGPVKAALADPKGFELKSHKLVSFEPLLPKGPQPHELVVELRDYKCQGGRVSTGAEAAGEADVEVNRLARLLGRTPMKLGAREVFQLAWAVGEVHGHPLYEVPLGATPGLTSHSTELALLLTPQGKLPFRYVTRAEALDHLGGQLERLRKDALGKAHPRAKQKKGEPDPQLEALTAPFDAGLARLAAVRAALSAEELGLPASVLPGALVAQAVTESWGFVDPKADQSHVCTSSCRHGEQLVTLDPAYFNKALPRTAPQFLVVTFAWKPGAARPDPALRDAYFEKLDVAALTATLK